MKTVLKIALGIILGFTVLIVGCVALIGGAANEVVKEAGKTAITAAEYAGATTGSLTREQAEQQFGKPSSVSESSTVVEGLEKPVGSECVVYNREGELASGFLMCFDINTRKLTSKSSF